NLPMFSLCQALISVEYTFFVSESREEKTNLDQAKTNLLTAMKCYLDKGEIVSKLNNDVIKIHPEVQLQQLNRIHFLAKEMQQPLDECKEIGDTINKEQYKKISASFG